jgi:hypothetical protein
MVRGLLFGLTFPRRELGAVQKEKEEEEAAKRKQSRFLCDFCSDSDHIHAYIGFECLDDVLRQSSCFFFSWMSLGRHFISDREKEKFVHVAKLIPTTRAAKRVCENNRQKCSPTHFLSKSIHSLCHGKKVAKKFALLLSFS